MNAVSEVLANRVHKIKGVNLTLTWHIIAEVMSQFEPFDPGMLVTAPGLTLAVSP